MGVLEKFFTFLFRLFSYKVKLSFLFKEAIETPLSKRDSLRWMSGKSRLKT